VKEIELFMGYGGHIQVFDWKKSVETKPMTLGVGVCQICSRPHKQQLGSDVYQNKTIGGVK